MTPLTRAIELKSDVEAMRRAGEAEARALGGQATVVGEVALLVTELGSNLLRHASNGIMTLSSTTTDERACLHIVTTDSGPGIADVPRAMASGYSTAGGLGEGLGLVRRLADSMDITSSPLGTTVEVSKWITPRSRSR